MPVGDTTITLAGDLTADPELRYTATGVAVAGFTVAASRRVYDSDAGQWKDGDTWFLRCSAWRRLAEHATESLTKGTRVVVTGRSCQRDYETTGGQKRTVYEVDADDVGLSVRFATAKVTKTTATGPRTRPATPGRWASAPDPVSAGAGTEPPL